MSVWLADVKAIEEVLVILDNIDTLMSDLAIEEDYLLRHFESDCDIMPGDIEGSFHRIRETASILGIGEKQ